MLFRSEVCTESKLLLSVNEDGTVDKSSVELHIEEESDWDLIQMLGIQSHLGEFASEGLRTLVLGVRFLTDRQCDKWLKTYSLAATAIKDRDTLLKRAAVEIEKELHIVGATAIEDKLQVGVPDTIATLEKAGIKLWVLTGDKRETAIEIGYSTRVLTPQMHLTEFVDHGAEFVRAQCAMEFMRLVKAGKLPNYQRAVVDQAEGKFLLFIKDLWLTLGKATKAFFQVVRCFFLQMNIFIRGMFGCKRSIQQQRLESINKIGRAHV